MFFQMPVIPELLLWAFDFSSMDDMMKLLKNTKTTEEDVEAYKYNFSHKGTENFLPPDKMFLFLSKKY